MKVKVTSVERRPKALSATPAAISVLTAEDIRRSGATNIPDLLRMVPGLEVARATGNTWAISSRGGQDPIANKLLVLIDGRSVYTPLFSGVYWDIQDIPLETIDRIEVIRGPGGSVWGSNAVNGVINIIRKSAALSQGTTAAVTVGTEDRFIGDVTTGWAIGERTHASAYGRYREFDGLRMPVVGGDAEDPGHQGGGGFRVDGKSGERGDWTVSGDGYAGQFFETSTDTLFNPPANISVHDETTVQGGNLLSRWHQDYGAAGAVSVQTYVDNTSRRVPQRYTEARNTWDIEAQHQIPLGRWNLVSYGAGFRTSHDRVGNTLAVTFDPDTKTEDITNVFLQDELRLARTWSLNLGTKLERNSYTGWEVQPSAQTAWEFLPGHTLWASVERAVRSPSRIDRDLSSQTVLVPTPLVTASIKGSDNFVSERLTAYEVGYRAQPARVYVLGLTGFYNKYDHLRGVIVGAPQPEDDPAPAHTVIPFVIANDLWGESFGGEFAQRVRIFDWWQVRTWYSYLHERLHVQGDALDAGLVSRETADPVHQVGARSSWNVGPKVELDAGFRWVDKLANTGVDDYTAVDARAAYKATPALTFELVGQNLLTPYHREFSPGDEVQRAVYGRTTWKFR